MFSSCSCSSSRKPWVSFCRPLFLRRLGVGSKALAMETAGIVSRIRLENFMCHGSLQIVLGDWVNFITGQNGSGKSAILTALCVAFGCRAKGTQRASTLKDFIKNGCSSAVVCVEIKNKGEDAFKPEIYGDLIMVERRITEATSSTILKDCYGKKVSQRKDDLREIVEHFNIDVENPCVIMSQDKSREFLHSGNNKDKFKFFFKATLLQQVSDLLQSIEGLLESANAIIDELESSIRPILKEINELVEKIKNMEHLEQISLEAKVLKKMLAWSWVYSTDNQILNQDSKIETLRNRIPTCQERIDRTLAKVEELKAELNTKKSQIDSLVEKTSEMKRKKDELQDSISLAKREKYELDEKVASKTKRLEKLSTDVIDLQQQIHDIQEQYNKSTQDVESIHEDNLKRARIDIDAAQSLVTRLTDEENTLNQHLSTVKNTANDIAKEVEDNEKRVREISNQIHELQQRQNNKVTAFGGQRVLWLLQAIERHHREFRSSPLGPIGVHVKLIDGDLWALAIENAIGRILDAFVVTDSKDAGVLRKCAKEANYANLQIVIYNFSRPRLNIPKHMLPSTSHPTIHSVLHSDNPVIMNVLVDMNSIERTVLVDSYRTGKEVAFQQRIRNLRDVYTSDGSKMFRRDCVETTLPPNRRCKTGRLCGSVEEHISGYEKETMRLRELIEQGTKRKRSAEGELRKIEAKALGVKRQRIKEQSVLMSKQTNLKGMTDSYAAESSPDLAPPVEELHRQILDIENIMQLEKTSLENIKASLVSAEVKDSDLKLSFEKLCDLAKEDIEAIDEAEQEFSVIEQNICSAQEENTHYKIVMNVKVIANLREAEEHHEWLKRNRQESFEKASIICPESDVIALGGCAGNTPEQLSAQLSRIKKRLHHESSRYPESLDDLRILHGKKKQKIAKKQQIYEGFHEKLNACQKALELRWTKFQRNAALLKRELTWQFNGHLRKKGISGQIKVNYDEKTLSVEVKMPQDASGKTVRDTRGLSGGERSFSTLCFALALHGMTESPFRAMDEFDVFMDAVSRKISLDTLVDFASLQGSQWILITPHDISIVKSGNNIKKQQMAAPRA